MAAYLEADHGNRTIAYRVKHCQTEANIYIQVSTDAMCDSRPISFREHAFLE